jgi:NAD(P)-dependent dehydrogenase (short-subunit alcohol dehydrogenase family)
LAVWFITGVSGGLGLSLANVVLEQGDVVVGSVRTDTARSEFELRMPGRTFGLVFDLRQGDAVREAIDAVERGIGPIDVLVNNAGYTLLGAVEEASLQQVRSQFDVNLIGPLTTIQAVLPYMRSRRRGHIVNVSSVGGLAAAAGLGIYHASKFALEGLSEALAQEVRPLGIKVTVIEPGSFRTDAAGRSLVHAERNIPDYEATAGTQRQNLAARDGCQSGDPQRAAAAIVAAVRASAPPLHLLLGRDALRRLDRKLNELKAEVRVWRNISRSTDFRVRRESRSYRA